MQNEACNFIKKELCTFSLCLLLSAYDFLFIDFSSGPHPFQASAQYTTSRGIDGHSDDGDDGNGEEDQSIPSVYHIKSEPTTSLSASYNNAASIHDGRTNKTSLIGDHSADNSRHSVRDGNSEADASSRDSYRDDTVLMGDLNADTSNRVPCLFEAGFGDSWLESPCSSKTQEGEFVVKTESDAAMTPETSYRTASGGLSLCDGIKEGTKLGDTSDNVPEVKIEMDTSPQIGIGNNMPDMQYGEMDTPMVYIDNDLEGNSTVPDPECLDTINRLEAECNHDILTKNSGRHKRKLRPDLNSSTSKQFRCDICNRSFTTEWRFERHVQTHKNKPYESKTYRRSLSDTSSTSQHIESHSKPATKIPGKSGKGRKREHRKSDLKLKIQSITTEICKDSQGDISKQFARSSTNKQLESVVAHPKGKFDNNQEDSVKCNANEDDKSEGQGLGNIQDTGKAKDKDANNHGDTLNSANTASKPYKCDICEKTFTRSFGLIRHNRIHTGEKPFVCNICGRAFTDSSTLRQHLHRHPEYCALESTINKRGRPKKDSKETPVCHICGKTFVNAWRLERHVRIHTGERPFMCEICGQTFADDSTCLQHVQRHSVDYKSSKKSP